MAGDGTDAMNCRKYGLSACLPHWSTATILNNDYQARFSVGCAKPGQAVDVFVPLAVSKLFAAIWPVAAKLILV